MGNEYLISPTRLHGSGGDIQGIDGQFTAATSGPRDELAGSSAAWGADEPGNAFGETYQQIARLMVEALDAISQGYETISANLHTMAGNVQAADDGSVQTSAQVGRYLST